MNQVMQAVREVMKPSAAAAGFLVVVGGTVGMMFLELPIPEPWWGVLGAAGWSPGNPPPAHRWDRVDS